jgi:hypothetical protein
VEFVEVPFLKGRHDSRGGVELTPGRLGVLVEVTTKLNERVGFELHRQLWVGWLLKPSRRGEKNS